MDGGIGTAKRPQRCRKPHRKAKLNLTPRLKNPCKLAVFGRLAKWPALRLGSNLGSKVRLALEVGCRDRVVLRGGRQQRRSLSRSCFGPCLARRRGYAPN